MAQAPAKLSEMHYVDGGTALPPSELQQLWFASFKQSWASLAVVPAEPGCSGLAIARALAEVGELHRGTPVKLLSAEGLDLRASSELIVKMTSLVGSDGMVIVALDSVVANQAGIPVALAADALLLVVELGRTHTDNARRTLELLGEKKFMGAVTVGGRGRR